MAFNNRYFNRWIVPASFVASVYGGVTLYKETRYKQCPSKERLDGKVVVVTGANSGIGFETTKELAARGATVVMGCRHMGRCENAARKIRRINNDFKVICQFLDLASLDSVEEFATHIRNQYSHIDVLINNAGVMKPRPPKALPKTDDGFERQLGINHLGHFLLTNLLIDKIKSPVVQQQYVEDSPQDKSETPSTNDQQPHDEQPHMEQPHDNNIDENNNIEYKRGRIINVTSVAYKEGKIDLSDLDRENDETLDKDEKLTELYYQSKLANVLFTHTLHNKYNDIVTSNCLHPGVVSTNISRYASVPFYAVGQIFMVPIKFILLKTPRQGAQTSIYLSTETALDDVSGKYFDDCTEVSSTNDICTDQSICDDLWKFSEVATELHKRRERIRRKEMKLASSNGDEQSGVENNDDIVVEEENTNDEDNNVIENITNKTIDDPITQFENKNVDDTTV